MEPFWLGVYGVVLFTLSALASALYHRRGRRAVEPDPGAWITLRCGAARLRCRFIATRKGRWIVTPLTTVGGVSPTRLAGDMLGMFGTPTGVAVFTTQVLGVDGQNVLLAAPKNARVRDRRICPRVRLEPPIAGVLDDTPVVIHNLGTRGAMVQGKRAFRHGSEVVLHPEGAVVRLTGFVLGCQPVGTQYRMRLLFDREVPLSFCWNLAAANEGSD